ncbi:MAG: FAD-dependent oxidoreductase [Armatimonadetes bacterium]|nr:FAD-dependent oxidoreductase [Armatimonadota bacterium]
MPDTAPLEPAESPTDSLTFPRLSDAEIDILRMVGEEMTFADRESLWKPGEPDYCFFVILEGGAFIADAPNVAETERIAYHGERAFTGDVDMMTGRPAPVGCYSDGNTRTLRLSAEELREIVRVEQNLGGKILGAFIRRREILLQSESHGILIVGSRFDPETIALREFLGRNRVVHYWRQPEDSETAALMHGFGLEAKDTPMVLLGDERLTHPSIADLADKLGVRLQTGTTKYDLVIIGAGPAGLAAAVYGASEGLQTLLLDRSAPGGQASWSSRIENYMGFPEGLTGSDLAARGLIQAQKFGAEISIPADVTHLDGCKTGHRLTLENGDTIDARAIVVATGAKYQKLDIPGFAQFEQAGVYYAATRMEADFCSDDEIVVVGAGNSAGQATVFLSQFCKKVRLVVRGNKLNTAMSDYLSYRVEQIPNVEIHLSTEVTCLQGGDRVERAVLEGATNATVPCAGFFVFIGATPNTAFLRDCIEVDDKGFVITGDALGDAWTESRLPFYLETSCPGVFAAGDCRVGSVKRVASSVGEGSMAVTFVHRVLAM